MSPELFIPLLLIVKRLLFLCQIGKPDAFLSNQLVLLLFLVSKFPLLIANHRVEVVSLPVEPFQFPSQLLNISFHFLLLSKFPLKISLQLSFLLIILFFEYELSGIGTLYGHLEDLDLLLLSYDDLIMILFEFEVLNISVTRIAETEEVLLIASAKWL